MRLWRPSDIDLIITSSVIMKFCFELEIYGASGVESLQLSYLTHYEVQFICIYNPQWTCNRNSITNILVALCHWTLRTILGPPKYSFAADICLSGRTALWFYWLPLLDASRCLGVCDGGDSSRWIWCTGDDLIVRLRFADSLVLGRWVG